MRERQKSIGSTIIDIAQYVSLSSSRNETLTLLIGILNSPPAKVELNIVTNIQTSSSQDSSARPPLSLIDSAHLKEQSLLYQRDDVTASWHDATQNASETSPYTYHYPGVGITADTTELDDVTSICDGPSAQFLPSSPPGGSYLLREDLRREGRPANIEKNSVLPLWEADEGNVAQRVVSQAGRFRAGMQRDKGQERERARARLVESVCVCVSEFRV